MILIFILGVMLGSSIGVMITCLCVIAKQSDERAERMLNRSNGDDSDTFIEDVGGWLVALFTVALIIMFCLLL
ncbi:DUF3789 domain-containing protein [Veillonella caviae]|uniref:DUF3789 domain-containing protein n=1 Tax=Veillonella caviae TaxID=248316 RepID=UPI002A91334B|nr:DUF3789 domain-containing protein [Veillonella caviae]MDY5408387.1 DUF3789 domain-containing protein [Veillonella caviae]